MNEFGVKGSINDNNFMIHITNTLLKEYHVIFDRHKSHLMLSGNDALTIKVIGEKLNRRFNNIKNKNKKKKKKKEKKNLCSLWVTVYREV